MHKVPSYLSFAITCVFAIWAQSVLAEVIVQPTAQATNLGLYGGQPEDIAVDSNSDAVYVANFAPSGIFHSADAGETWEGLPVDSNFGTGKAVEVDYRTGDVYALIGDSILRSSNLGQDWTDLTANLDSAVLGETMVYAHDTLIAATSSGKVKVSTDRGETFTEYPMGAAEQITWLTAAESAETFYAVAQIDNSSEKLYRSSDGGMTWEDMDVHNHGVAAGGRFYEITVDPADETHLVLTSIISGNPPYQSVDSGDTWVEITGDDETVSGGYGMFDANGRLYIGTNYSDNATDAMPIWEQLSTVTPASSIYADTFMVDPKASDVLFTNSALGLAKSIDRGQTWTDQIDGITSVKIFDIAQSANKDVVWLGANGGLARTENFTDAQPDWEYPVLPAPGLSNFQAVWVHPDNANIIVAGLSTFLSKSSNGGETWTQSSAPAFAGRVQDIVHDPNDVSTLYAIYWDDNLAGPDTGGVLMSSDTGTSWTDLDLPGSAPTISLAVSPDSKVYVGIGGDAESAGVYLYTDNDWSLVSDDFVSGKITSILVDPADVNKIFVTVEANDTSGRLYVSTDGGANWEMITKGIENANHLDSLTIQSSTTPLTMYVAGQKSFTLNGMVYKSGDGGETWSEYYEGLKQEKFYALLFDGLVVGNDRGIYEVKSRAQLKLTARRLASGKTSFQVRLQDATTKNKLKRQTISFYKRSQSGQPWKKFARAKTDQTGKAQVIKKLNGQVSVRATWKPRGKKRAEYVQSASKVKKLKAHQ